MTSFLYRAKWSSPSNIAFIKYWGKRPVQLPENPSLSMTLENSRSITELKALTKEIKSKTIEFKFSFQKKEDDSFKKKIQIYFEKIASEFPFLYDYKWEVFSENTFPHSAGIASSASFFSSLACCLVDLKRQIEGEEIENELFLKLASTMARLGSGSASRSLYGPMALWGKSSFYESSDEYAVCFPHIHESFSSIRDAILIVDSGPKSVSSTEGHGLMLKHPFASTRFDIAQKNLSEIVNVIQNGDWPSFGEIIENEALQLHALMMTSRPYFILIKPQTLHLINSLREYRRKNQAQIYFTLDAGPNLHLIYPSEESKKVEHFVNEFCRPHLETELVLYDLMGKGPRKEL